jgi:hypothetical protein
VLRTKLHKQKCYLAQHWKSGVGRASFHQPRIITACSESRTNDCDVSGGAYDLASFGYWKSDMNEAPPSCCWKGNLKYLPRSRCQVIAGKPSTAIVRKVSSHTMLALSSRSRPRWPSPLPRSDVSSPPSSVRSKLQI